MTSDWRSAFLRIRDEIGTYIGATRTFLRKDELQIAAYRGFGTAARVFVLGRVLEDESVTTASADDPHWKNLLNTFRRIESDEVPGARVRVRFAGTEQEVMTDSEGFFELWVTPSQELPPSSIWHDVELELLEPPGARAVPVRATARVLVPPSSATFGVVSDIDDTVLQSSVTDVIQMARLVLLGNARTRLPFKGVAAFYRALHRGATAPANNPIFYVSSSPWNLFDLLNEFLELQGIPAGPLALRDWSVAPGRSGVSRHGDHKHTAITRILDCYPTLPFILIGDSTQEDPEIYAEVVRRYPTRILAIYIRSVTPRPERVAAIRALATQVTESGSTLVLCDDTAVAARHAAERGWIAANELPAIIADSASDTPPTPQPEPAPVVVVEGEAPKVEERPGGATE